MRKRKVLKAVYLLCAAISAASFAPPVEAQIDFKLRTEDGGSTLTERYYYNRGDTVLCPRGIFNGCAVSLNSIQIFNWTDEFSGYANVNSGPQTFSISGNLAHNGVDNQNQYGEARANHVSSLYADVLPGMSVKVKFRHSSSITWNIPVNGGYGQATWAFTPYPLTAVGGGVAVNTAVPSDTRSEPATVSAITAMARASSPIIVDGGKTYYFLGTFDTSGYLWMERQAPAGETGSFSSSIDNIAVRHIGKALYYNGGAGQTGRAGQTLPLAASVKVLDETTNSPVTGNAQIAFYITDPNGVETGLGQAWKDYYSGIADKAIPLGLIPGTYTITAVCPDYICVEGGRTVTMTAVARGKALVCVDCAYHGRVSRELENPFRLKVVDMFDGGAATGAVVTYEFLRFTDTNNNTSADRHGAEVTRVLNAQSDIYGMSRAFLKLGTERGVYAVRARCESCLEGQEQIPTGTAHGRNVVIEAEEETAGDPTPNQEPCPSGCCPYTPVLRARAGPHNSGGTFTSAAGENRVDLAGYLLPLCLNQGANITWAVADDSIDHNGGTPAQPQPGFSSFFEVGSGDFRVPDYPHGRALPLSYKATASYDYNGTPLTASRRIKQDEIDKCRQEYVDREIPSYGNPIPQRNVFRLGTDPDFAPNVKDCYAYIYPTRAQEAINLRNAHNGVAITGSYRSPRKNWDIYKNKKPPIPIAAWTSRHMFGDAVDLGYSTEHPTAQDWGDLWEAAGTPKIFEKTGSVPIMTGAGWRHPYYSNWELEDIYALGYCVHLGE